MGCRRSFAQANQHLREKACYCAPAGALAIAGLSLQGDAHTALHDRRFCSTPKHPQASPDGGRMWARSARTQLCLQYSTEQLAVGALFLARKLLKLPPLLVGGREWWTLHQGLTAEKLLGAPRPCYFLLILIFETVMPYSRQRKAAKRVMQDLGEGTTPKGEGHVSVSRPWQAAAASPASGEELWYTHGMVDSGGGPDLRSGGPCLL